MTAFSDWLNRSSLYIALPAAWIATLGSLYFSEVAGFVPCELCWYQRILMYPLALILLVGLLRRDENLPFYVLPFSGIGLGVALYHYLLQKQIVGAGAVCAAGVPCTTMWINWGGFITIPFLALIAFVIITVMALIALLAAEPVYDEDEPLPWRPVLGTLLPVVIIFAVLFGVGGRSAQTSAAQSSAAPFETIELAPGVQPEASSADASATGATVDGARLYRAACAPCHGPQAEGVPGLGNALVNSEFVQAHSDADLLAFIRAGRAADDPANTTGLVMPPSGGRPDLSDAEVLAIIHFLRTDVGADSAAD